MAEEQKMKAQAIFFEKLAVREREMEEKICAVKKKDQEEIELLTLNFQEDKKELKAEVNELRVVSSANLPLAFCDTYSGSTEQIAAHV